MLDTDVRISRGYDRRIVRSVGHAWCFLPFYARRE